MNHVVISTKPFIVVYNEGDQFKTVEYAVPLLNSEIRAEYDYIVFDEPVGMRLKKLGQDLMLMDGHRIISSLN